eukprot:4076463-Amphidinium_carterae.3
MEPNLAAQNELHVSALGQSGMEEASESMAPEGLQLGREREAGRLSAQAFAGSVQTPATVA